MFLFPGAFRLLNLAWSRLHKLLRDFCVNRDQARFSGLMAIKCLEKGTSHFTANLETSRFTAKGNIVLCERETISFFTHIKTILNTISKKFAKKENKERFKKEFYGPLSVIREE